MKQGVHLNSICLKGLASGVRYVVSRHEQVQLSKQAFNALSTPPSTDVGVERSAWTMVIGEERMSGLEAVLEHESTNLDRLGLIQVG